jgi:hypothetical protein
MPARAGGPGEIITLQQPVCHIDHHFPIPCLNPDRQKMARLRRRHSYSSKRCRDLIGWNLRYCGDALAPLPWLAELSLRAQLGGHTSGRIARSTIRDGRGQRLLFIG